jgi:hypothetical protein
LAFVFFVFSHFLHANRKPLRLKMLKRFIFEHGAKPFGTLKKGPKLFTKAETREAAGNPAMEQRSTLRSATGRSKKRRT